MPRVAVCSGSRGRQIFDGLCLDRMEQGVNPARELEIIFTKWDEELASSLESSKGTSPVKIPAGEIIDVIHKITAIDKVISNSANSLIPDGMYDEDLVEWAGIAVQSINGVNSGMRIPSRCIRDLQKLASVLDMVLGGIRVHRDVIKQNEQALRDQLRNLADDIQNDSTLDGAFVSHAVALIDHVHRCLDDLEGSGFFDLGDALRMLMIYVDASQTRTSDKEKQKKYSSFNDFLKHPFVNTVSGALLGGVGNLLQIAQ